VVLHEDAAAGTELTATMLGKVSVRADRALFRTAVPYSERGLLLNRRLNRALKAGEGVCFADVRNEGGEDVRANLRPGEASLTVAVRQGGMAPGIRAGDQVGFLLGPGEAAPRPTGTTGVESGRLVGPFRVLGVGALSDPTLGVPYNRA